MTKPSIAPELATAVFIGAYIPMHDTTFEIAESIGGQLEAFYAYVAKVRDEEQAAAALAELGEAIAAATAVKEEVTT